MNIQAAVALAQEVTWSINDRGYVGASSVRLGRRKWTPQHRWVCEVMLGTKIPSGVDVHHVNGCTTDNRPGNLMVIGHGPHAWEPYIRNVQERKATLASMAFEDMRKTGGVLSSYTKQLIMLAKACEAEMEPDESSWERIAEFGFWSEGEIWVAGLHPFEAPSMGGRISRKAAEELPHDHPDKEFWMAFHEPNSSPRKVAFNEWYVERLRTRREAYNAIAERLGL